VQDGKYDAFFRAIIGLDEDAMPGLAGWRNYFHNGGPIPEGAGARARFDRAVHPELITHIHAPCTDTKAAHRCRHPPT
jgi:hypothetical protein